MSKPPDCIPAAMDPFAALSPERDLARCWAGFTKTLAIYPERNTRVQVELGLLLEALARDFEPASRSASGGIEVFFFAREIYVGAEFWAVEPSSNLSWLKERIEKAALAGVEFQTELRAEDLMTFTKRLLEHYMRSDLSAGFEQLWPGEYGGVKLIARRFEGDFGASAGESVEGRGGGGKAIPAASSEAGVHPLVRRLAGDDDIIRQVHSIREKLVAENTDTSGEARQRLDLLALVFGLIPLDRVHDYASVRELTRNVLDGVAEILCTDAEGFTMALEKSVRKHLGFLEGSQLFAREGPTREAEQAGEPDPPEPDQTPQESSSAPTSARPEDDLIENDLGALLTEIEELPPPPRYLKPEDIQMPAEQVGVLLHLLVSLGEEKVHLADGMLRKLLENAREEELEVLAQYLAEGEEGFDADANAAAHQRVLEFLRGNHLVEILRHFNLLGPEQILKTFPRDFALYLETIDWECERDRQELVGLCEKLGYARIVAAAGELTGPGGLLDSELIPRLLAIARCELLPLAQVVLMGARGRFRSRVIKYIRRLDSLPPEACLCKITQDPRYLSDEYLQGLIAFMATGDRSVLPREQVAILLGSFIRTVADHPDLQEQRVQAIHKLAEFRSANSLALLDELWRGKKYFLFFREPAPIREAARFVLRFYATSRLAGRSHV